MTAGIAQSERSVTTFSMPPRPRQLYLEEFISQREFEAVRSESAADWEISTEPRYRVQRPSVEWSRDITETDMIFNLVLNYDEAFTGHIDDLISSARQIITNHRARTASQMEEEDVLSSTIEGSHNCQLVFACVKRPWETRQDNIPPQEPPNLIKSGICEGVDPRIELAARLRSTLDEYKAVVDNNLDTETLHDLHNILIAITMELNADAPISDESAYLTRDYPSYSSTPQGIPYPIASSNSRPRRTVASYETLSPIRNPPVLYYYSDDDDNEEQSRDHQDEINETVIPSSLTADTIPEEDKEMESSVDSGSIVPERRF